MCIQGVERIYEDLTHQIENSMAVFVATAQRSCFSFPHKAVDDVHHRRSTVYRDMGDMTGEATAEGDEILAIANETRKVGKRLWLNQE